MAKLGKGEKDYLPIKIEITQGGTGAETRALIAESESAIGKRI